jgi:lysophospholipase L1-like esterase
MKKIIFSSLFVLFVTVSSYSQLKIVCIGNSITQGTVNAALLEGHTSYSWRYWLWLKFDSAGVNVTMVGYNNVYFNENADDLVPDFPPPSPKTGHSFPNLHEAYWGITSSEWLNGNKKGGIYQPWESGFNQDTMYNFEGRINHPIRGYTPDIALIHIGTNDDTIPDSLATTIKNINTIINILRAKNPNITVFLAKLETYWSSINRKVDSIASSLTTENSNVIVVDQTVDFINNTADTSTTDTYDWVHPNRKGQNIMAQHWYNAVMMSLPTIIETPVVAENIDVYPNPSSGTFTITNAVGSMVDIINLLGEVKKTIMITSSGQMIDLNELADGAYMVRIIKGNLIVVRQISLIKYTGN